MIDKQYGMYQAVCDGCGRGLDDDAYDDFHDALAGMKANGWKTSKLENEWVNYCPDCARKLARPSAGEFAGI